jgi:hypothetical protein
MTDSTRVGVKVQSRALRDGALERQLGHNPRRYIHRGQFLKEQLASIRDLHQRKVRPILTRLTEVNTSLIIIRRNDPTLATYVNFVFIRTVIHAPPGEP